MGDREVIQTSAYTSGRTNGDRVLPAPSIDPPRERTRQLVLLVEDDPNDLHLYGTMLWYNGFDVLEARDGESAITLAGQHRPDLVLLDILLPDMTGIEVSQQIRKTDPDVPLVALTARARSDFEPLARKAGCVDYLEKPIGPLSVLHAVEDILGRAPSPGDDDPDSHH